MKKIFNYLILLLVLLFSVWAFSSSDKPQNAYITKKIEAGNIVQKITATGTINPISTINIGTQVSGTISEIYVDYNSQVKKDQLLAQIDPALFEATVAQRKAALDIANAEVRVIENDIVYNKKNLNRIAKLNKSKYSTDKDLELAQKEYDNSVAQLALKKAQVEQAAAALSSAEIDLRYTKILSPVDGIVVSKEVEVGQTVAASFQTPTLFNVAEDLTKMQIEASVVEADIAKVKEGQTVEFSVDSFPDEIFYGIVTQVRNNPITTSNVVTYEVIIEVNNKDLRIKPGMTANVEIITAEKENVLLLPNKALRFFIKDENGEMPRYKNKGVWILKNNKPERISVTTGISDDDYTEVSGNGIISGQEVIIETTEIDKTNSRMKMRMPR